MIIISSHEDIEVTNISSEVRSRVTVHTVQLLQEQGYRENEACSTLSLIPGEKSEIIVPVVVCKYSIENKLIFHVI